MYAFINMHAHNTYTQACMCPCIHTNIHWHTHRYACIQNVIPGNMSFKQKYVSDHGHKRINMATQYKIFMNCNENFKGICKIYFCQTRNT